MSISTSDAARSGATTVTPLPSSDVAAEAPRHGGPGEPAGYPSTPDAGDRRGENRDPGDRPSGDSGPTTARGRPEQQRTSTRRTIRRRGGTTPVPTPVATPYAAPAMPVPAQVPTQVAAPIPPHAAAAIASPVATADAAPATPVPAQVPTHAAAPIPPHAAAAIASPVATPDAAPTEAGAGSDGRRTIRHLLRDDSGMSTVEYAIGTVAAAAFAAILYAVISGDSILTALTDIVQRALSTTF